MVLPLSASRLVFVGTNSLTSPVRKTEARKCKLDRYRLYDSEEAKNLDAGADDCSRADGRSVPALIFQVRCSILVRRDNEVHGPESQNAIARGQLRQTNGGEILQQRLHRRESYENDGCDKDDFSNLASSVLKAPSQARSFVPPG